MHEKIFEDVELVKDFDHALREPYEKAKNSYQTAPIETLILVRQLTTSLCNKFVEEYQVEATSSKELRATIDSIKYERVFPSSVIELMHKLRQLGNKGAHPDLEGLDKNNYKGFAKTALKAFCSLINELNISLGRYGRKYEFVDSINTIQEISYRAVFLDEAQAKCELGKALIFEGQNRLFVKRDRTDSGYITRGVEWLEEAAISQIPEAQYEMGLVKLSKLGGEPNPEEAINFLFRASQLGHVLAMGYFGVLVFQRHDTELYEEALNFLLESAEENSNPLSLVMLAELYLKGEYVSADRVKATEYLNRAVELEYPQAFYMNAKINLLTGQIETAIELLEQCEKMDLIDASLELALVYLRDELRNPNLALKYFERFLNGASNGSPNYSKALYYAAKTRFSLSPRDFSSHYSLVSEMISAYQLPSCDSDTRQEIESQSPMLMKQYLKLLRQKGSSNESYLMPLLMINSKGIPKRDMSEVVQPLIDSALTPTKADHKLTSLDFFGSEQNTYNESSMKTKTLRSDLSKEVPKKQKKKIRKANKKKRKQSRNS